MSVLDQRFAHTGALARLKRRGVEVHVRSAFLQGVLIADLDRLPERFASIATVLARYRAECRAAGLSPAACALKFVCRCEGVDRIVIGVDSLEQLRENLQAYSDARDWSGYFDFSQFALSDPDIIDPRRWPKAA
jgi:aryl-alcohol dehydrogenase-like predicted oxidoreductase